MQAVVWLKIAGKKGYGAWRSGPISASKSKPNVDENEIAFKLTLDIPDEVFQEPVYEAKLVLPKNTRQLPETTEISKEVAGELSKRLGFKVKLEMPEDPPAVDLV